MSTPPQMFFDWAVGAPAAQSSQMSSSPSWFSWKVRILWILAQRCSRSVLTSAMSLMMQLGVDGVFVGSGIFKSTNPEKRARAIVQAVAHYNDAKVLAEVSTDLGAPMTGINCRDANIVRYASRDE